MEEDQVRMKNWLRSLGAPESILQADLSPLLRAEDSSMWRHLQRHVVPTAKAIEVRQTILLDIFKEKNILPGRFGNFKINSVEEMEQVVTYLEKKDELAEQSLQIERVDSELKSSELMLVKNSCKCKILSHETEERTMKAQLLSGKVIQVKKNLDYLNHKLEGVRFRARSEADASMDMKTVEKFVCSIRLENHNPEGIKYVLDSLRGVIPRNVLCGLERASRSALVTLVKIFNDTESQMKTMEDKLRLKNNFSIEHHLSRLQETYLENEIKLSNIQKDYDVISIQLSEDKAALVEAIIESMETDCLKVEEIRPLVTEFVDVVAARRGLQIPQVKKTKHLINMEIQQLKHLQEEKIDLQEKNLKSQSVLEEKLSILKALAAKIVQNDLIGTKKEILGKCTAIAAKFMDKQRQYKEDPLLVMSGLMLKELELLVKLPLRVITRSWEEDDYLPEEISRELQQSQPFVLALLQSHPKDLLITILEKITVGLS